MGAKRKKLDIKDPILWYLVGVITSDGCLSPDGRHVSITANDKKYLETLRNAAGIVGKVGIKKNSNHKECFHLQVSNVGLYEFLLSIGLSPRKSLIQKEVNIPPKYFVDFCRGVIDGDGNIRRWIHPSNQHEQWVLRIYSASAEFIIWFQKSIEQTFGAKGRLHIEEKPGKNRMHILKYGKIAAMEILKNCYYQNALALDRKAQIAQECCGSKRGWARSNTVCLNGRVVELAYT